MPTLDPPSFEARTVRPRTLLAGAAVALALTGACSSGNDSNAPPAAAAPAPAPAAVPVAVRLVAFNDFHGHLQTDSPGTVTVNDPTDPARTVSVRAGGAAFLAAKIDELRAGRPNTVVVSTGDLIGGSPLVSALFRDEPTVEVMNAIGIDFNVVGNHEFDKGRAELDRIVTGGCAPAGGDANLSSCARPGNTYAGAKFGFLAANVVDTSGKPIHAPYLIKDFGGTKMGFIGVVTRTTPNIVVPTGITGLAFRDEAETINRYAGELRAQGVHAIAVLLHEGGQTDSTLNDATCANARGEAFTIADRLDRAVDIVFSGHTHQAYNCVRNGIPIIQGSSFGKLVSVVDLMLDPATGDVARGSVRAQNQPVPNDTNTAEVAAKFPPPAPRADVAALVKIYADLAAPKAQRQIGSITAAIDRTPSPGGDHPAGSLIADAQLASTRSSGLGDAVIAFMNPGGVRANFTFTDAGAVTFGQAFTVQPFGNSLVTMTLTGAQIDALLEQQFAAANATSPRILQPSQGFTYAWSASAPAGAKVDAASIRLNGQPVVPAQRYRVTVNSFLADGGDGFTVLQQGTDRLGGAQDIDVLIAYFAANSPVAPPARGRITRLD